MAYITGSVTDSFGVLPFSLSAGTQLTMSIQNSLSGHSYFGLETVPNSDGFYDSTAPKNISGSFVLGSGIVDVVYDDYKMVAVVKPGGGTLTYTPAVAIDADTLRTRGTGASLGQADFATLAASSYSKRVTEAGGYVESPNSITAAITATPILKDASFLYIPSGYASGTAFSELSTNDYGDLTWSRTSDGTRTNSEGLVQRVPWNLLSYSEEFSNAYWAKSASTLTANVISAPNGTLTADQLNEAAVSTPHGVFPSSGANVIVGQSYVMSMYVKKGNRSYCGLEAFYNTTNGAIAFFNLDNGTLLYQFAQGSGYSITNSSITNVGNDWYLLRGTFTVGAVNGYFGVCMASTQWTTGTSYNNTYLGDTSKFMYIWGAQLVEGTSPQSYLPTTTRLNVPRLDYTYGTSPASLMEPQRTNLALYSEQFDNAGYAAYNSTVTANTTTAPDGNTTADSIAFGAFSDARVEQVRTGSYANNTLTISVFAKVASGTSTFRLKCSHAGVVDYFSTDLTATTSWQRFSFTTTFGSTAGAGFVAGVVNTSSASAKTLQFWGLQVEVGAYPTTYIPTTSATVTRIADSFSRGSIYTNGMITSAGGTWFGELRNNIAYTRDATQGVHLGDGLQATVGNVFRIWFGTATRLSIQKVVSGSATNLFTTTTDTIKFAIKWNGSSADVFINGTKEVSATLFTATQLEYLIGNGGAVPIFIQAMAFFNQPLAGVDMGVLTGASYYTSYADMAQANNYTIA